MRLTALLLAAVTGLLTVEAAPAAASGAREFLGITYARADRWGPPVPVRGAAAAEFGPACPQPTDLPIAPASQDEDCLTLNVTTPARRGSRPVLVYLHGGSFNYGSGMNYNPRDLVARGDIVAVTINYRLGALGFLAHPALGDDAANLGLLDQQAALRWVRDNIAAFGGDPRNVTIMGQSAGGLSVCAHLVSPLSAGLFHRAIIQSAAGCDGRFLDRAAAEQQALDVAAAAGCADIACLRRKSAAELVAASGAGHEGYRPVGGGRLLPRDPGDAFASGRFNRVPVLFGSNHDEETGALFGQDINEDNLATKFAEHFGDDADAVRAEYPVTPTRGPVETLAAALTDRNWALPADTTRRLLARHVPVHAYEFAERETPWFPGFPQPGYEVGASHMLELPYLFSVRYLTPAAQQDLRGFMIDSWARFIRTGDPGWQRFQRGGYVQSLASGPGGVRPADFAADHRLDFWRALASQ